MKYILVFLTFGYLVIGLYACKKILPNKPIDADLKAAFSFKPGTYWIYKDSVSGRIDSFFVYSNNYTIGDPSSGYEKYDIEYDNINVCYTISSIGWELYGNNIKFTYYMSMNVIQYPFNVGQLNSNMDGTNNTISTISSFTIAGNIYNNVAEISNIHFGDLYYISADIGLIKIKFNHFPVNPVWELQRYHIVH